MSLTRRVGTLLRSAPESMRGTPAAVAALLTVVLCAYTPSVWRNARGTPLKTDSPAAQLRPASSLPAETLLSRVLAANLFGTRPGSDAAAISAAEGLVLSGVIATSDPKNGFAIIGETADTERLFHVGEDRNGIRLVAVYSSRVLLERGGATESLELRKWGGAGQASEVAVAAAAPARPGIPPDSAVFGAIINAHLNIEEEKQTGYVIYPGEDHESFNKLGLRSGDVIVAVNGHRLTDPANSQNVLGDLSVLPQAAITVLRSGKERSMELNLAQGQAEAATRRAERDWSPQPEASDHS